MRYAKKVWKDPSTNKTDETDSFKAGGKSPTEDADFTLRHKIIAIVVALLFGYIIYSVLTYGWGMVEMAGPFVAIGIIAGLIGGMDGDGIVNAFIEGAKGVLAGAILIGVARGVSVIMEEALIIDTLVYYFGELLQTLPVYLSAIAIFIFITLFNFLVPSGSGKALVTMPIISPLASIVGLNQQVAVLAFQLSDGLTNIIYPTSGYFMATLSIADVSWGAWAKFYGKLLLILSLTSIVLLVVAQAINYGPF